MIPHKHTRLTFLIEGKTYNSLAELAREAGISYIAAAKRHQRGFSDHEIFYGKNKTPKVISAKKSARENR